jgi:hypothetical protein
MHKPFEVLWEAMETRRRQLEAGAVPPAYHPEHLRQEQRQARGCPDVEALCGWVDGQLRRNSRRRWLAVWRHVRLQRCRACREETAMMVADAYLAGEMQPPHQRRSAWLGHARKRILSSLLPVHVPMAWVSGTLVVAVGLSLWLISQHGMRDMEGYRVTFPPMEERSERPQPSSEPTTNGQAGRPIIWGD